MFYQYLKTMKISKKEIRELHKDGTNGTRTKLEELFPKVFTPNIGVGQWHIKKCSDRTTILIFITKINTKMSFP